ncbi:hypothetical protein KAT92_05070, partial [Candidatus Babeliales bacterium]|nr:hypothetical protein [Candidatus Babeliales bacterium]
RKDIPVSAAHSAALDRHKIERKIYVEYSVKTEYLSPSRVRITFGFKKNIDRVNYSLLNARLISNRILSPKERSFDLEKQGDDAYFVIFLSDGYKFIRLQGEKSDV